MQGRRIIITDPKADFYHLLELPGDYVGPLEFDAGRTAVYFLLPPPHPVLIDDGPKTIHCVASPPHVFREEPDGSLTIRESILSKDSREGKEIWHGYLTEGRWELSKSKP